MKKLFCLIAMAVFLISSLSSVSLAIQFGPTDGTTIQYKILETGIYDIEVAGAQGAPMEIESGNPAFQSTSIFPGGLGQLLFVNQYFHVGDELDIHVGRFHSSSARYLGSADYSDIKSRTRPFSVSAAGGYNAFQIWADLGLGIPHPEYPDGPGPGPLVLSNYGDGYVRIEIDREEVPVPEPSTFLLLGAGILGAGLYTRRRMKK